MLKIWWRELGFVTFTIAALTSFVTGNLHQQFCQPAMWTIHKRREVFKSIHRACRKSITTSERCKSLQVSACIGVLLSQSASDPWIDDHSRKLCVKGAWRGSVGFGLLKWEDPAAPNESEISYFCRNGDVSECERRLWSEKPSAAYNLRTWVCCKTKSVFM